MRKKNIFFSEYMNNFLAIRFQNPANLYTVIGEGNGNPLQCSCLENPRDSGAWWAAIYGVTHSQTRLKRLSSSSSTLLLGLKAAKMMQLTFLSLD